MLEDTFGFAHRYELNYPHEVMKSLKEIGIVYFPFGVVEEHGTHQDMTADLFAPHCIGLAAAAQTDGLVYRAEPSSVRNRADGSPVEGKCVSNA